MRCLLCGKLSWHSVCKDCFKEFCTSMPNPRILENGLKVYSFFNYSNIAPLLHVKHQLHGSLVLNLVAKKSFGIFAKNFKTETKIKILPIDDHVKNGYSHTAILAQAMKMKNLEPVFGTIRAKTFVNYSGKSLAFRKANPRKFICKLKEKSDIILVDDIVTTGCTLLEASNLLQKKGHNVLFALTLADAKDF